MSRHAVRRKGDEGTKQNFLAGTVRRFARLAHYMASDDFVLGDMIMRYQSAFAVPSGFAVATRTATKGKTTAVPDDVTTPANAARTSTGRSRQMSAGVLPVRAA